MASFSWHLLVILLLSLTANSAEEEAPKEKKQLSPSRLRAEGDAAFQNRDYNKALKYFNQLIDIEPTVPKNFHKRALTYLFKNKYWKAVKDWGKAIKLDETFKSVITYSQPMHTSSHLNKTTHHMISRHIYTEEKHTKN